jgi:response regulator RpfG family c-di-GMP phosphodiesterase
MVRPPFRRANILAHPPEHAAPRGASKRIFIVDDALHADIVATLRASGYEIVRQDARGIDGKTDGGNAIYLISVTQAGFDGIALIRHLRKRNPDTRIIAVSQGGRDRRPDLYLTLARIAGADPTLFRPSASDLLAALPHA